MKPVKAYIVKKEELETLMNDFGILGEKHKNCGGTIKRVVIKLFLENEKSIKAKLTAPQYPALELAAMRGLVLGAGMCDKCEKFGVAKNKEE